MPFTKGKSDFNWKAENLFSKSKLEYQSRGRDEAQIV